MNEFPFQNWMERTANYSCVMACGVYLADNSYIIKTYHEAFPELHMSELLQCLAEVASTLHNNRLGSSRLRWVFENGQIHFARCSDGSIAVLATIKDPAVAAEVEELFAEFLAAGSVTPELPGQAA